MMQYNRDKYIFRDYQSPVKEEGMDRWERKAVASVENQLDGRTEAVEIVVKIEAHARRQIRLQPRLSCPSGISSSASAFSQSSPTLGKRGDSKEQICHDEHDESDDHHDL